MDKARIVVVEDEGIVAYDIATRLKKIGHEVVAILSSGEEAVEKVGKLDPELVLMDIMLAGEMDGIEAANIIHSRHDIPVVFLTAYADSKRVQQAKMAYPFGYVVKPFESHTLRIAVEMALHVSKVDRKRRKAEEALRESEKRLHTIVEATLDAIIAVNAEGRIVLFNGAAEELFQYKEEEVLNLTVGILLREEASQKHQHRLEKFLKNGVGQCGHIGKRQEKIFRRKDGSQFEAEVSMSGGRSNGTRLVVLAIRDITEKNRAETALKDSLSRSRAMLEAIPDIMFRLSSDGVFLDYKADIKDLYAQPKEGLIGKRNRDLTPPEFADLIDGQIRMTLESGKLQYFEYQLPIPGRGVLDYEARMVASGKDEVTAIVRDITERKNMEEQLLRTQKLESLGVLAGGIAHDFNNMMGIVQGYIELAQMELPSDHVSSQRLTAAMRSISQTRDLTSRLITFSLGGGPIMELFADVRETLRDAVLRTIKGTTVKAKFNLTEKLWPIEMDELQLKQCFYNLTANALEAMPDGGTLTIRAENYEMTAEHALPLKEGCYIKITFTDEGPGIPEEYLQKVFDPYFTTKGMGLRNGMGLGLSVCHSVLKNHNGHIAVESTSGKGTSFALYLPAKIVHEKAKKIENRLPPGTGRVLIMDDDPDIRDIERAYLEQMGYEVTDVKEGQEAIDAYKKAMDSGSPIDLVILDLTVHHGLGGLFVMDQLLKFDPLIKAIIVSGSFNDPAIANYANYGFQGAMTKPFKRVEMKNLVEAILHG